MRLQPKQSGKMQADSQRTLSWISSALWFLPMINVIILTRWGGLSFHMEMHFVCCIGHGWCSYQINFIIWGSHLAWWEFNHGFPTIQRMFTNNIGTSQITQTQNCLKIHTPQFEESLLTNTKYHQHQINLCVFLPPIQSRMTRMTYDLCNLLRPLSTLTLMT